MGFNCLIAIFKLKIASQNILQSNNEKENNIWGILIDSLYPSA